MSTATHIQNTFLNTTNESSIRGKFVSRLRKLGLQLLVASIAVFGLQVGGASFASAEDLPSDFSFAAAGPLAKTTEDAAFTNVVTDDETAGTGAITYASDDLAVATVDEETGLVTIVGVGSAVISATKAASAGFTATTKTYTVNVTMASISPSAQTRAGFVGSTLVSTAPLVGTNFVGTVSYAITSGTLPTGLSLSSSTGVISGAPTATSTATVVITGSGSTSGTATASVTFAIVAKPVANTSTAISIVPMVNATNTYTADLPGTAANIPVSIVIPSGATGTSATAFEVKASASSSDSYTVLTITALAVSDSAAVAE